MGKLLIFGSGFLVRHISAEFVQASHEVKIIYNMHPIQEMEGVTQIQKDSYDIESLLLSYQPDFILFAVGDSFVPDNTDIEYAIQKNLMFSLMILEKIYASYDKLSCIKKIIIIGSAAEYGNKENGALAENMALHPVSIYGLTKIFLYNTAMYYAEKGLPIIYARQFNAIGPYQRESFVLSSFCKQVAAIEKGLQKPEIEVGDLSLERDFIDARDAASAYRLLFENGRGGDTYNVGSGNAVCIQELLDIILQNSTLPAKKIHIFSSRKLTLNKSNLSNKLLSDNSKLKKLGFTPNFTLAQTVIDTLNYWRNHV